MVAYRAILDVPAELVAYLAGLLADERRARGTRAGTRALSCWRQAVFALVWFRERRPVPRRRRSGARAARRTCRRATGRPHLRRRQHRSPRGGGLTEACHPSSLWRSPAWRAGGRHEAPVVMHQIGDPDVLEDQQIERPRPHRGKMLVRATPPQ